MSGRLDLGAVMAQWRQEQVASVHAGLFDIDGVFREKWLPLNRFEQFAQSGWQFIDALPYWSANDGLFADRAWNSSPCAFDADSVRGDPFAEDSRICVAEYSDALADLSPRSALQRQLDKAQSMGFFARGATETELILLQGDSSAVAAGGVAQLDTFAPHNRCWASGFLQSHDALLRSFRDTLARGDIEVDHMCAELGPGCLEVSLAHRPLLRAADDCAFFKLFSKSFFQQHQLTCSFMAQLSNAHPGLGGHPIVSLWHADTGEPAFFDARSGSGLSLLCEQFAAGVVKLVPELTALFASTVNAYRRYVPGNWAPRTATWGNGNFTCGLRAVSDTPERTRLEFRLPGADFNPFTAFALVLGAGLYGIERQLPMVAMRDDIARTALDDTEKLPRNLLEAAERFASSAIAREIYGDRFVDHFAETRVKEDEAMRRHVCDFERRRYLFHV